MEMGKIFFPARPAGQFYHKEIYCEQLFQEGGPYWHLCTPGIEQEIIFTRSEEMIAGLNLLAVTAVEFNIRIFTECLMNNHLHIILECDESVGIVFFRCFKKRLSRYLIKSGRCVDLSHFIVDRLIEIESLDQMRKEIVYVNRNGYTASRNHNPFSYPWGTGCLYFNDICELWKGTPIKNLTYREQRRITHRRATNVDYEFMVMDGYILPSSYCYVKTGESFFRDNWHYFSMLTKNYEAYSLVAHRVGESGFLTDEEIYNAVVAVCMKRYAIKQPKLLSDSQKYEMIVYMHNELSSTNDQIRRILNVDIRVVNDLFPLTAR